MLLHQTANHVWMVKTNEISTSQKTEQYRMSVKHHHRPHFFEFQWRVILTKLHVQVLIPVTRDVLHGLLMPLIIATDRNSDWILSFVTLRSPESSRSLAEGNLKMDPISPGNFHLFSSKTWTNSGFGVYLAFSAVDIGLASSHMAHSYEQAVTPTGLFSTSEYQCWGSNSQIIEVEFLCCDTKLFSGGIYDAVKSKTAALQLNITLSRHFCFRSYLYRCSGRYRLFVIRPAGGPKLLFIEVPTRHKDIHSYRNYVTVTSQSTATVTAVTPSTSWVR